MQLTDWIKKKTKSLTLVQNAATNFPLKTITSFFQAFFLLSRNNNFFSRLSNLFQETITSIPQNSNTDVSRLMKKRKYYKCKRKGHIILNCPEKVKVYSFKYIQYK